MQAILFLSASLPKVPPTNEWDVLMHHGPIFLFWAFCLALVAIVVGYLFLRKGRVVVSSESHRGQNNRVRHEIVIETPPEAPASATKPKAAKPSTRQGRPQKSAGRKNKPRKAR